MLAGPAGNNNRSTGRRDATHRRSAIDPCRASADNRLNSSMYSQHPASSIEREETPACLTKLPASRSSSKTGD
jgi:hypothetical protein